MTDVTECADEAIVDLRAMERATVDGFGQLARFEAAATEISDPAELRAALSELLRYSRSILDGTLSVIRASIDQAESSAELSRTAAGLQLELAAAQAAQAGPPN